MSYVNKSNFKELFYFVYTFAPLELFLSKIGNSYSVSLNGVSWFSITKRLAKKVSCMLNIPITKDLRTPAEMEKGV